MILVTGGTGFIGRVLVRHLNEAGLPVRLLIRPTLHSPKLPPNIPVEIATSSLTDMRGLRSAMVDVEVVYHLASSERQGARSDLLQTDIQGTQAISQAAAEAGVKRLFFLSHLGADRGSAYPVFKAKGIAEEHIRKSNLAYTIIRTAIIYGRNDHFTNGLVRLIRSFPYLFLPDDGAMLLQPLWVEDLATCLVWALYNDDTSNQTYSIGGPEYLPLNQVALTIMQAINLRRRIIHVYPPYLRGVTVIFETIFPGLPTSVYWLDYLATNRTCPLDTTTRVFNLIPGRLVHQLDYLQSHNQATPFWRSLFQHK